MRVAVVGAGAFGRNHARVYRELERQGVARLAAVVDCDIPRARDAAHGTDAAVFASVDDLLEARRSGSLRVDAASVAVPTVHHAAVAGRLMEAGVDVLIEKPLTATLDEADALIALAARCGRVAQAGHLERFNPAVQATLPRLARPMFFEVHRLSVFSPRSLDVDVVLDLMIHDLDVVLTMARSAVREVRAVGLPVLSPHVDIANARVEFASGCVANFTASRVSTERVRKLRFFQPHQYVSIDYARRDALLVDVKENLGGMTAALASGAALGTDEALSALQFRKLPVREGEPLRAEIESFLNAVRTRGRPAVTLEEGRAALALALEIRAEIERHHRRAGIADRSSGMEDVRRR